MSAVSMHGGLERPMSDTIKMKPELQWRPQDAGGARVLGHLPGNTAKREWKKPKRKKYSTVNPAERSWSYEKCLDIRNLDAEFGACPAGFQSLV